MKRRLATALIIFAVSITGVATSAAAQTATGNTATGPVTRPERSSELNEHRGPPKEAIEVCRTLSLEAPCRFTGPRGSHNGKCWQPDSQHPLACRPAQKPQQN